LLLWRVAEESGPRCSRHPVSRLRRCDSSAPFRPCVLRGGLEAALNTEGTEEAQRARRRLADSLGSLICSVVFVLGSTEVVARHISFRRGRRDAGATGVVAAALKAAALHLNLLTSNWSCVDHTLLNFFGHLCLRG